jgi:hypothetical protein
VDLPVIVQPRLTAVQAEALVLGDDVPAYPEDFEVVSDVRAEEYVEWSQWRDVIVRHIPSGRLFRFRYRKPCCQADLDRAWDFSGAGRMTEVEPRAEIITVYRDLAL